MDIILELRRQLEIGEIDILVLFLETAKQEIAGAHRHALHPVSLDRIDRHRQQAQRQFARQAQPVHRHPPGHPVIEHRRLFGEGLSAVAVVAQGQAAAFPGAVLFVVGRRIVRIAVAQIETVRPARGHSPLRPVIFAA